MNSPASVESRDRIRLFAGFPLPEETCAAVVRWQDRALGDRPGRRLVPRSNLHITLAFLGPRPRDELDAIRSTLLAAAAEAEPPVLTVSRYRETRSVGMIVFDDARGRATAFAGDLHERLEKLGVYERERRPWLPHLTVLRFRTPPRLRPPLPELGEVSPSEAALYHSVLRPTGAQYEVLDSVALGG